MKSLAWITSYAVGLSLIFTRLALPVSAGDIADEIKKIGKDAEELDKLMLDYKDLIEMKQMDQAKNLNYKLVRYLHVVARIKEVAAKVEALEGKVGEYEGRSTELNNNLESLKSELAACRASEGDLRRKVEHSSLAEQDLRREISRQQSLAKSNQSRVWELESQLKEGQRKQARLESELADCRAQAEELPQDTQTPDAGF